MTANELQKRNEKADSLRVLQTDDGQFFVESSEGKILYSVAIQYEETDALRQFLEGIKGRKFKLDCGHHVTFRFPFGFGQGVLRVGHPPVQV